MNFQCIEEYRQIVMHCVSEILLIIYKAQKLNKTSKVRINSTRKRSQITNVAVEKTYSEYVFVALVIQYAKRMRRDMLSPVACPV